MNKTQNVFRMLELIRLHKSVHASQLARMLQVDVRTVHRYMGELRAAGYEFKTKSGQRGHIEIDEEGRF